MKGQALIDRASKPGEMSHLINIMTEWRGVEYAEKMVISAFLSVKDTVTTNGVVFESPEEECRLYLTATQVMLNRMLGVRGKREIQ